MKNRKINRREAIQKSAKYAGITALSTFLILNPKTAQASSCSSPGNSNCNGNSGNSNANPKAFWQ